MNELADNRPPDATERPHDDATADRDPSRGRQRGWQWALVILGPVVTLLIANFAVAGLAILVFPDINDSTPGPGQTVAFVVCQSTFVCVIAIGLCALLLKAHRLRLRDAGLVWTRASAGCLLLGIGAAAAVVLALGLPLHALGLLRPVEDFGLPVWALLVAGLFQALVLQGFPEELLFRGYQMTALRVRPVTAVLISALVFAVIHLISGGGQQNLAERVLYLATPFGFAVTAGALMIVTRSLWAAVGVHAGLHIGSAVALLLGIGSGPWMWVLSGLAYTIVGVVLLMVARRRGQLVDIWTGPTR